ncbi:LysM peptidoglycan-binding domain-containing protein [Nocardioides sp. AX2bis]|uniref:LysM peptidoglycan-binding domain-containing protein n=1 Tax=Nocardioides sp. AX2bis TaxID=2653157 RepID=UPI0012F1F052|nr:LysM domain-containing protein [Nocardioides sp. AX2bis]VXB12380.1 conserved exported hypothetical protein [Nocardioides sp. AX2bis]
MTSRSPLVRRLAVAVAATAGMLLVVALALPELGTTLADARVGTWRSVSFEDLLVRVCAVAALTAGGCWWTGVLRLVVAAGTAVEPAHLPVPAGLPPWLGRAVLTACGVALVAAPAAPALAAGRSDGPGTDPIAALALPAATGDLPGTGPGGLPLPDRVAGEAPGTAGQRSTASRRPGPTPAARTTVRVSPGDSLWQIAETQLRAAGAPVDDAAVATRWQEIYAANAERIGPDPDLVLPGQHLDLDRP